jgi:hypothetical protein
LLSHRLEIRCMKIQLTTINPLSAFITDESGNYIAEVYRSANRQWRIITISGKEYLTTAKYKRDIIPVFIEYVTGLLKAWGISPEVKLFENMSKGK